MDLTIKSQVRYLPGVGPVMAKRMEKLGIQTIYDLLYYSPFRYDDFTLISRIADIQPGEVVTIAGTIDWNRTIITKKGKKMQQAMISDDSGTAMVIWFNQPFLTNILQKGVLVRLAGEVSWFGRRIALISPSYEIANISNNQLPTLHTGRLVPIYPETEGLSSKWLRTRIAYAIEHYLSDVTDFMPDVIQQKYSLGNLKEAINQIHYPQTLENTERARLRLAFDELFLTQLSALIKRYEWISSQKAHSIMYSHKELLDFTKGLPFILTPDQDKAIEEIGHDLARSYPANRLLEGDVGAGKTVVAAAAMYLVHKNKLRSILMAPTEILANQHFKTLSNLLALHGISVGLVTGSNKNTRDNAQIMNKESTKQTAMFSSGKQAYDILVGTHALLGDSIDHTGVGLVVIDEQQRFGVRQRILIRKMDKSAKIPHLLTMTATPIPRTVALTVFGNLDLSVLHTLPLGRKKVRTWVVSRNKREKAYEWIIRHVKNEGGQVFILCPLVEESENLNTVKAAQGEYIKLKKGALKSLRLGLLHGRMTSPDKQQVLEAFRGRNIDVLVATPVVEVGIDIPNATVMMIEASERFGLSTLHQLRGRVGRGEKDSFCFLFTESEDERVLTRLKALETKHSGPELAQLDLELRGPGEMFGTKQHGIPQLRYADFRNTDLISKTRDAAQLILDDDPKLKNHPLLREKIKEATIGETTQD